MKPAGTFGTSASDRESAQGCADMCGMCPSCVFAPTPPASTRCLWKVSDYFKRNFVFQLLLRCRNRRVLEDIHGVLAVATSGTLFTYVRSRSPISTWDYPPRRGADAVDEKPVRMDVKGIWLWFNSSNPWIQSRYLCRLFCFCDCEFLRMAANLTSVLLVRQKRRFLHFKDGHIIHTESLDNMSQHDETSDEDSVDPALAVMPGSSKSVSGVCRHRDFICFLPVDLSKRILGLLDEKTLKRCLIVSRCWMRLTKETFEERKFRKLFQKENKAIMKRFRCRNKVNPTYANIANVPVPVMMDEEVDFQPEFRKGKPFEAAYAKLQTKTVQMEERNVYCAAYFTTVLVDKVDPNRVVDYQGGPLLATGSKDRLACLFHVASETKALVALSGHSAGIRAVLLCHDRGLLITASLDTSIRCWSLQTDRCEMVLQGHTGPVNCLDIYANRLVSGAKDCRVKVWDLQTGKDFEGFHFYHPGAVQCVKIYSRTVYSGCNRRMVRVWDTKTGSLLREIDAHQSSVRCLFVDQWHFLTGDTSGNVMAWSVSCDAKDCLMTFKHPKEIKSVIILYLRVITGCIDGKIRIFNLLTGVCLRDITAETEGGQLLSLHFHDDRIIVNSRSSVKLYQFAKVFWDYTEPAKEGRVGPAVWLSLASDKSFRKLSAVSRGPDRSQKTQNYRGIPEGACALYRSRARALSIHHERRTKAQERCETPKRSLERSEKATSERMKKRGLHHPPTRDFIVLKVNAIQKALCLDEAGINMERNARLRDSWGPPRSSQDPAQLQNQQTRGWRDPAVRPTRAKTCVPNLKRAGGQNRTSAIRGRDVCTAPADTSRGSLADPEWVAKTGGTLPRISSVGTFTEHARVRRVTVED